MWNIYGRKRFRVRAAAGMLAAVTMFGTVGSAGGYLSPVGIVYAAEATSPAVTAGAAVEAPDYTFTTLEGETVTSRSENGRPKLLILFGGKCGISKNTMNNLSDTVFEGVDVVAVEVNHYYSNTVETFRSEIADGAGKDAIQFCAEPDRGTSIRNAFTEAYRELYPDAAASPLPLICYIDADNKFRHMTWNVQTADDVRKNLMLYCGYGASKLEKPNLSGWTFTTLTGESVSASAQDKPKVLVFYNSIGDPYSLNTLRSFAQRAPEGIDLYAMDIMGSEKETVETYLDNYRLDADGKITYCYGMDVLNALDAYKTAGNITGSSLSTPLICYIDSENRLQYVSEGESNSTELVNLLRSCCGFAAEETEAPGQTEDPGEPGDTIDPGIPDRILGITAVDGEQIEQLLSKVYINTYEARISDYSCEGGDDNSLSYAFDQDWKYTWTANEKDASITVLFEQAEEVSRILYGVKMEREEPDGYPTLLRIETSQTTDGDDFVTVAEGTTEATTEKVVFTLEEPVRARRMKLVFADTYNDTYPHIGDMRFLGPDQLFEEVEQIFEYPDDPEKRRIRTEYSSEEALDRLEKGILDENHLAKNYLLPKIDRARKVVTGEVDLNEPLQFPDVEIIQKTGPDSEKMVVLFAPERYVFSQIDDYVATVKQQIQRVFRDYEPYRSFADEFNIYVLRVPSNETYNTGSYALSEFADSYFRSTTNGLIDVMSSGLNKAIALCQEMEAHYLDEGSKAEGISLTVNSTLSGGATALDTWCVAWQSSSGGFGPLIHELTHTTAKLMDEYSRGASLGSNVTNKTNPFESPWKEMLGFRGVKHEWIKADLYRPGSETYGCMMDVSGGAHMCEVCQMSAYSRFNNRIADKREVYIAKPIAEINFYVNDGVSTNFTGATEITPENIASANGQEIQYRTIARNLTTTEKTVRLEAQILAADGSVKAEKSAEFVLKGNDFNVNADEFEHVENELDSKKSLQVILPVLTNLTAGDRVTGRLVDAETGEVLMNGDTHLQKDLYQELKINYRVGNAETQTEYPLPNVTDRSLKLEQGISYQPEQVDLNGYTYTGYREADGDFVPAGDDLAPISMDANKEITYYYTMNKGKVTLKLTDLEGETVTKERYIKAGERFVPSQKDFPAVDGYHLVLPEVSEAFDGMDETQVLEYSYTEGDPEPGETYAVTVTGGSGSGSYEAGAVVTIRAEEPEAGKEFVKWQGAEGLTFTSGSVTSMEASFTMPERAVNLTAVYEAVETPDPEPAETYAVTVTGGSGSGSYEAGAVVTIRAEEPEAGQQFVKWQGAEALSFISGSATSMEASFTMPERAVYLTAVYEAVEEPEPEPAATYAVTVTGGSGSGSYEAGAAVAIKADEPEAGKEFVKWQGAEALSFISGSATSSEAVFKMPERAVSLVAVYEAVETPEPEPAETYAVTVTGGSGSGSYEAGAVVTIRAEEPEAGKEFVKWQGAEGLSFISGSATSMEASFTMPERAVSLSAVYEAVEEPEPEPEPKPWIFDDVNQDGGWKHKAVDFVYQAGMMNAINGTRSFQPDRPLERAMLTTILHRWQDTPAPSITNPFRDLEQGSYYYDAVIWAAEQGIVSGMGGSDRFVPKGEITREQIAKMLYEYGTRVLGLKLEAGGDLSDFTDTEAVSDWAVTYMQWATGNGIITGKPNDDAKTSFRMAPGENATRAECAAMLQRFAKAYVK